MTAERKAEVIRDLEEGASDEEVIRTEDISPEELEEIKRGLADEGN